MMPVSAILRADVSASPSGDDPSAPEPGTGPAADVRHQMEEPGVERPPLWRRVAPWVITGAILWWVFRDISFADFLDHLSGVRLSWLLPALFGYTAVFAVLDILSFGLSFRWFAAPSLTYREMTHVIWGCYLPLVIYAPIVGVIQIAYFVRHKGAPFTWFISAGAFAMLGDLLMVNAVMTVAMILNILFQFAPELDSFWLLPMALPWLIAGLHFWYWFTDSRNKYFPRLSQHALLRSARHGELHHYLRISAARLTLSLVGILAHALALHSFGIEVPLPVVMVVAPLIIGGAFLPISGGGFGGPQLVALILLPYAGGDEALLAAYSMSFSACFTIGRALIGGVYLPRFLEDLRDTVPRMTVDPLTGEPI